MRKASRTESLQPHCRQHRVRKIRLRGGAALAALITVVAVLAGCSGGPPGKPPSSYGPTADRPVPASIRNIVFTTSTGAHTSLDRLRGKVVVLADFLTLCGEECPMTSANMNLMARTVSQDGLADKVVFVEVSVDPHRDTPARMSAYRNLYRKAGNWMLLTTSPANLRVFCKYFGIYYKKTKEANPPDTDWWTGKPLTYDIAHQDAVVFLGKQGHERLALPGQSDTQGATPPTTLYRFLDKEGRKNLTDPGPRSWTVPEGLRIVSWLLGKKVTT